MAKEFLYTVSGTFPHKDGKLLLPGIDQDNIAIGNVKSLHPGSQISVQSSNTIVCIVEVINFAVYWDMENSYLEEAAKAPISLVIQDSPCVLTGMDLWLIVPNDH